MGHCLAYQDTKYDQQHADSTISTIWRSTYQASPAELRAAYASLNPTFLQRMQVRNIMYIREPLSLTTKTSNADQHSSANPARRSVLGMKDLLPLKLLSPNPSDNVVWPSSAPCDRTTFGMRLSLRIDGRPVSMMEAQRKPSAQQARRNRDMPIYTEPGTPLPGLAYFDHDDACLQHSSGDEACTTNDEEAEQKFRHQHALNGFQNTIEKMCDGDDGLLDSPLDSTSPFPTLSFQCSGNDVYPDEPVWMRSPLNILNWPRPNALSADEMVLISSEHNDETWLSDVSSYFDDHGDSLACATVIAPSKANVVDLSPSSGLAISIPARSSSLDRPVLFMFPSSNNRYGRFTFHDSPPNTPVDGEIFPPLRKSSFGTSLGSSLARQNLDPAMISPPLSPSPYAKSGALRKGHRRNLEVEKPSWPLFDSSCKPPNDIISSLEEWAADFPSAISGTSAMLAPESDCISNIRSKLSQAQTPRSGQHNPQDFLMSPYIPDSDCSQRPRSLRRRKTTDLSRHRETMTATAQYPPPPTPFSLLPQLTANPGTQSPDLKPIQNVFPNSSKSLQSSLYAYVLAYTYATSSLQAPPLSATVRQRRRNTPCWNTNASRISQKAADILGICTATTIEVTETAEQISRMQALQDNLRKCIFRLIRDMDGSFGMENTMGLEKHNTERSSGMIILRSLIEVVRSAEERSSGFF